MSNATCSGVAKSAKVIAVKVFDDHGCVYYLFPRSLPVRVLLFIGSVVGPTCTLLSHKKLVFFLTEIHIPNRISGINWVTKVAKNSSRPSVASLSFGGGFYASVNTVAANLVSSGVTTVVAAYNDGADAANYSPAGTLSVITVGASTIDDAKAYYSNYGPVLDL